MFALLQGKKTYITGIMTVLGAVAGVLTGDVVIADAVQLTVTAILGMTIRHGVK